MALVRSITRVSGILRSSRGLVGCTQHVRSYADEAPKSVSSLEMNFSFGMPGAIYYKEQSVKQVDVPSTSGTFGILAQHVPLLAVLKPGVITITEDNGDLKKFFVSSGSVTINADSSVQILAEAAFPLDQLDPQLIKQGLSAAQQELSNATTNEAKAKPRLLLRYEAMDAAASGK